MRILNFDEIQAFNPCYDITIWIAKDWSGTVIDILNLPAPAEERLWGMLRPEFISEPVAQQFYSWCKDRDTLSVKLDESDTVWNRARQIATSNAQHENDLEREKMWDFQISQLKNFITLEG